MIFKEIIKPKNIFIGVLLLTNVISISLLVKSNYRSDRHWNKEKKSKKRDQFIIDKIGFDSSQADQFKEMKENHLKELCSYRDQLNLHRKDMFSNLSNDSFDINAYSQKISNIQSEMDKMAFIHFKEMRTICRPDQLQKFDQVMQKIMTRMPKESKSTYKKKERKS